MQSVCQAIELSFQSTRMDWDMEYSVLLLDIAELAGG